MKRGVQQIQHFFTDSLWLIDERSLPLPKRWGIGLLKRATVAVDSYLEGNVTNQASSLTYSSILATVPILAIIFAIGRGFGYGNLIEEQIREQLSMNQEFADIILNFINSYLAHTQSGIFVGVGLLLLLYTLIQLTSNIEFTFNSIWQVKTSRNIYRRITDYLSVFILLPILMVVTSGFSIFMLTVANSLPNFQVLDSTVRFILSVSPHLLSGLAFTALYMYMPNTDVRFTCAVFPGMLAGIAFQSVQYFYIHSQIWVSSYNAIYGSFAALPMFMLWLQVSWNICLFGAVLSYANQNVKDYGAAREVRNISRRYHDFLMILIASKVCKRYEKGIIPYTPQGMAAECSIPVYLATNLLTELCNIRILTEAYNPNDKQIGYIPAQAISRLTVDMVLSRIDTHGNEKFSTRPEGTQEQWEAINRIRTRCLQPEEEVLLKDL